jgi:RNA polymerase sigma-70 factor (ECF subfamily)
MKANLSKYRDAELIAELKKDRESAEIAFSEIYSRYSQRVYAYCIRMLGHVEDAQDVFQETFLKFYDIAPQQNFVDNIPALLYTISRNLCFNHKRDLKTNLDIEDYALVSNDKGYDQKELLQLVARALELLDFDYREAFILRQYHGLSYDEIISITGESLAAIKNRVWRAKEKLKEILAPYLEDLSK